MNNIRNIAEDWVYVGASTRSLSLFENIYPVPEGMSYNSYLLKDDKTALLDTSDAMVAQDFFENLSEALQGRILDYLIVNHMEPDHGALIQELFLRYPQVRVVTNAKAAKMIQQFFDINPEIQVVNEGDTLCTGKHTLTFVMAPMVHWPEAMFTYDISSKILFSADAFGTFGAINGNIYADETNFEQNVSEYRRYYANIVGKYGVQVQAVLKKAATLDIAMICPLHGPIWRKNLASILDKYQKWSSYEPEEQSVLMVYGSIYGHTKSAMETMASLLAQKGVKNIALYDASHISTDYLLSEAFRCSHIVLGSITYNAGIFTPIEHLLLDMKAHNLQNRTVVLMENGTWAAQSGMQMKNMLMQMKNINILGEIFSLKSAMKAEQMGDMEILASLLVADMKYSVE